MSPSTRTRSRRTASRASRSASRRRGRTRTRPRSPSSSPRPSSFVGFQPKPGWTRTDHDGEARPSRSRTIEGETVTERIADGDLGGRQDRPRRVRRVRDEREGPGQQGSAHVPGDPDVLERRGRPLDRRARTPTRPRRGSRCRRRSRRQRRPLPRRRLPPRRPRTTTPTGLLWPSGSPASSRARRTRAHARAEAEAVVSLRLISGRARRRPRRLPRCRGARRRGGARLHLHRDDGHTRSSTASPCRSLQGDDQLHVRNDTGREIVIQGYEGEPYLRFDADGERLSQRELTGDVPERGPVRRRRRARLGVEDGHATLGARRPRQGLRLARPPDPLDEHDRPGEGARGERSAAPRLRLDRARQRRRSAARDRRQPRLQSRRPRAASARS